MHYKDELILPRNNYRQILWGKSSSLASIDTVFAWSDATATIYFIMQSRAVFIKLSVIHKIFCKCKDIEKSYFYKINKELWCSDLVLKQPSNFLMSRYFATKRYLHGTSNPFPCFLLSMISHDDHPLCLKKCQTSLDSVRSCNYCTYRVYSFDISIRDMRFVHCVPGSSTFFVYYWLRLLLFRLL